MALRDLVSCIAGVSWDITKAVGRTALDIALTPGAEPATQRPLNGCSECEHTWYPRGGDQSARCPKCKYPYSVQVIGYEYR